MIPEKIIIWCGWIFIWALGIGFIACLLAIAWDKVANRIDRMWIRGESTSRLKRIVANINDELSSRGELK